MGLNRKLYFYRKSLKYVKLHGALGGLISKLILLMFWGPILLYQDSFTNRYEKLFLSECC